jgi:hypothetical protein
VSLFAHLPCTGFIRRRGRVYLIATYFLLLFFVDNLHRNLSKGQYSVLQLLNTCYIYPCQLDVCPDLHASNAYLHLDPKADDVKKHTKLHQTLTSKMPAASVASAPVNRTANRAPASRTKKATGTATKKAQPASNGAPNGANPNMSPYTIMASRIANRVAEMAENITFVERERYVKASGR